MSAPLPLGLKNPYQRGFVIPLSDKARGWEEGAMAGARAVIDFLRTEVGASQAVREIVPLLEHELKGER